MSDGLNLFRAINLILEKCICTKTNITFVCELNYVQIYKNKIYFGVEVLLLIDVKLAKKTGSIAKLNENTNFWAKNEPALLSRKVLISRQDIRKGEYAHSDPMAQAFRT